MTAKELFRLFYEDAYSSEMIKYLAELMKSLLPWLKMFAKTRKTRSVAVSCDIFG